MPPSPSPRNRFRAGLGWFALALLGLVIAAGVSLAASRLSSQHIGLSSEPLSAGQRLSPAVTTTTTVHRTTRTTRTTKTRTTQTTRPPTLVAPAPAITRPLTTVHTTGNHGSRSRDDSGSDDHSGSGSGGGGGGHGGDD
jgi:uncharacterized membrane protein YgcG